MAIDAQSAFVNTNNVAFPDTESVNASGPTATDGTEFVKVMIDNYMFGRQQALLDYASLTPDGNAEAAGASQEIEAMKRSFGYPGESVVWYGNQDPGALGLRVLLLEGQGILAGDYLDLVAATYVGDLDNGTAEGFFRADNSDGTSRNINGAYFILPDARGLALRALDDTGLVDVDRMGNGIPGDSQLDAFQGHIHQFECQDWSGNANNAQLVTATAGEGTRTAPQAQHFLATVSDGIHGTPRVSTETRMMNISAFFGIRY